MIVILTGAGISQESGIPTFRDSGGLWENASIEDVATPNGFARNPGRVLAFYNERRRHLFDEKVAPNAAHLALARLEKECPMPVTLITQNVDNLHERAGSVGLLHMHGELLKSRCTLCQKVSMQVGDLNRNTPCPQCGKSGGMRPHIVWFEETPLFLEPVGYALAQCRLFVSIGTSGNVYPAAGFVQHARSCGAYTLELNLEQSTRVGVFHEGRYGKASQIVPAWVDEVLEGRYAPLQVR